MHCCLYDQDLGMKFAKGRIYFSGLPHQLILREARWKEEIFQEWRYLILSFISAALIQDPTSLGPLTWAWEESESSPQMVWHQAADFGCSLPLTTRRWSAEERQFMSLSGNTGIWLLELNLKSWRKMTDSIWGNTSLISWNRRHEPLPGWLVQEEKN